MAKNPDLLQKTYYLHKKYDKELIIFLNNTRNTSELVRKAILREIQIQKGEITVIDNNTTIKNVVSPTNIDVVNDNTDVQEQKQENKEKNEIDNSSIKSFLNTCLK